MNLNNYLSMFTATFSRTGGKAVPRTICPYRNGTGKVPEFPDCVGSLALLPPAAGNFAVDRARHGLRAGANQLIDSLARCIG